jgi:hypothetical protein
MRLELEFWSLFAEGAVALRWLDGLRWFVC